MQSFSLHLCYVAALQTSGALQTQCEFVFVCFFSLYKLFSIKTKSSFSAPGGSFFLTSLDTFVCLFVYIYLQVREVNVCILNSLWFLLCMISSDIINVLSQIGIHIKLNITSSSLVFFLIDNWIGPKIAISALFGVMPIQRSITSWYCTPYTLDCLGQYQSHYLKQSECFQHLRKRIAWLYTIKNMSL